MSTIVLSHSSPVTLRALQADDLPALMQVQSACYGQDFIESADVYARRLASPVNCSLVYEIDGQLCAYLAAYRSTAGKITPLHGDFERSAATPDTLYLHDMAVLPAHAGQGLARALLASLWAKARELGLRRSALVSVQDSQAYWARHGYIPHALQDAQERSRLASYGDGAVYMVRSLGAA